MKVLAIDTSIMNSSIAILEDNTIIGSISINQEESHSEKLVPLIDKLLKELKLKLQDIDLFAVAKGPGSFTGLRIGVTTIKAMAQALDKAIVGISTLEAMSYSILNNSNVCALIDARGKRYFAGFYKWNNGKLILEKEEIIEENDLRNELIKKDNIIIVGEGIKKLSDEIKELENVNLAHPALNNGIAKNIAVLAKEKYENGEVDNNFELEPNYLRKSQAEINFEKNN